MMTAGCPDDEFFAPRATSESEAADRPDRRFYSRSRAPIAISCVPFAFDWHHGGPSERER